MTTLVGVIAIDNRQASALYLMSDSRITWEPKNPPAGHIPGRTRWDAGRKLFVSHKYSDIFGFCGYALLPIMAISQIIDAADRGVLFDENASAGERHRAYYEALQFVAGKRQFAEDEDFSILHGARNLDGDFAAFKLWHISYKSESRSWQEEEVNLCLDSSAQVIALGTGSKNANEIYITAKYEPQGDTTRNAFWAFWDALENHVDPLTGGAPQLVGLYRTMPPRVFGIVYKGDRYLQGLVVPDSDRINSIEWRDKDFQRVDGSTFARLSGAQPHRRDKHKKK